ncbi:MAG: hydroxymethylglutaryl-CoA reductase [Myxococcota bacterium]
MEKPCPATTHIPTHVAGPVHIESNACRGEIWVPLATFETPLIPCVNRGAKVSRLCGGIRATVMNDNMTRSIVLQAPSSSQAVAAWQQLNAHKQQIAQEVESTTRFGKFVDLHGEIVGNLLFIRLAMSTGDAAGHNMLTAAADKLMTWILQQFPYLQYISISGNTCSDKKVSAINSILGRGKSVVADLLISSNICEDVLHTTAQRIVHLHHSKNLMGSIAAGSIRSANAHFANMLLAFYLATGQDAANIIEGSQGIVHAQEHDADLYFSVTLPNLIVGTVGNGKHLDFARKHLELLGCNHQNKPQANAQRLAVICAATVLCGELSLLAAQTNPGELMRAHRLLERRNTKKIPKKVAKTISSI